MFKTLLVPLDGSDRAERAMRCSIELARQLGASIVGFVAEPEMALPTLPLNPALYAAERDAHEVRTDTHAHGLLSQFGTQARLAGVPFTARHRSSDRIDEAIAELAAELEDAMIVMVTHGRGAFGELMFGSRTKGVMARTKVPLLVLH